MEIEQYKKYLKKAMAQIPEGAKQKERFIIPAVKTMPEGKNTIILNFSKIIQKLNRDVKHFLPIFLKNIGTMGEYRREQLFLKGRPKKDILNRHINDYVTNYVLCKICNKPDTNIVKEDKKLYLICQAYGARNPIIE